VPRECGDSPHLIAGLEGTFGFRLVGPEDLPQRFALRNRGLSHPARAGSPIVIRPPSAFSVRMDGDGITGAEPRAWDRERSRHLCTSGMLCCSQNLNSGHPVLVLSGRRESALRVLSSYIGGTRRPRALTE
jgi:hypothetical protein